MQTIKTNKAFDAVKMKNEIQAKVYEKTKHMDFAELKSYINKTLQNDAFWKQINSR